MSFSNLVLGAASSGGNGFDPMQILFIGSLFLIMYFFMIRPQSKKNKDQKNFINDLEKGDRVVTSGGIHGKVLKINEDTILIEVDTNAKMKVEKGMISHDFSKAAQGKNDED